MGEIGEKAQQTENKDLTLADGLACEWPPLELAAKMLPFNFR